MLELDEYYAAVYSCFSAHDIACVQYTCDIVALIENNVFNESFK